MLKINSTDLPLGEVRIGSDTIADGQAQHLLGLEVSFENKDYSGSTSPLAKSVTDDSRHLTARLVRNISGSDRLKRRVVQFSTAAGQWGKAINAYSTDASAWAGVVDPFLPAKLEDDQIGWIIRTGPVDVENNGDGVIEIGDRIVAMNDGQVAEQTSSPANEGAVMGQVQAFLGRAEEGAIAEADTVFRLDLGAH